MYCIFRKQKLIMEQGDGREDKKCRENKHSGNDKGKSRGKISTPAQSKWAKYHQGRFYHILS